MSAWPPATLTLRLADLRETSDALANLDSSAPDAIRIALARYVAVRSAGYLEAVRDDLADLFVSRVSIDVVANRVRSGLRQGQGVQPQQLVNFVATFHATWGEELSALFDEDDKRLRNAVGALVSARKKVAHGDGDNVTAVRATTWASAAEDVGSWLVRRFDPSRDFYKPIQIR